MTSPCHFSHVRQVRPRHKTVTQDVSLSFMSSIHPDVMSWTFLETLFFPLWAIFMSMSRSNVQVWRVLFVSLSLFLHLFFILLISLISASSRCELMRIMFFFLSHVYIFIFHSSGVFQLYNRALCLFTVTRHAVECLLITHIV